MRGLGRDADVVLEVFNGIAFFTALWNGCARPRVLLVFHVHQEHYVAELGLRGRIAGQLLEHLPLRLLYRGAPVIDDLAGLARGPDGARRRRRERIHVVYCGARARRAPADPEAHRSRTLLYLGRLKHYKRIELLLDVLEAVPEAHLDDRRRRRPPRRSSRPRSHERGLRERVTMHGHVDEAEKARLLGEAWVDADRVVGRGLVPDRDGGGRVRTPSAALRVGGLEEAIVDGETGVLADDARGARASAVGDLVADAERARRLGAGRAGARAAASRGTTPRTATSRSWTPPRRPAPEPARPRCCGPRRARPPGSRRRRWPTTRSSSSSRSSSRGMLGKTGYGSLAALHLRVPDPAGGRAPSAQLAAAREAALDRLGTASGCARRCGRGRRRILIATVVVGCRLGLLQTPLATIMWRARGALGGRGDVPDRRAVDAAVAAARRAAGPARLRHGGLVDHRRGHAAAGLLADPRVGAGLGVTGALLGTAAGLRARVAVAGARAAPPRRARREAERPVRDAALARRRRLGADRRPVPARRRCRTSTSSSAKHQLSADAAGAYAAAAVAAKAVVWVAIGIGLHLLPEATRRSAAGLDPRPVLLRALTILAIIATPRC